jgi:hypothetical protein
MGGLQVKLLYDLVARSENWLIKQIAKYAQGQDYSGKHKGGSDQCS